MKYSLLVFLTFVSLLRGRSCTKIQTTRSLVFAYLTTPPGSYRAALWDAKERHRSLTQEWQRQRASARQARHQITLAKRAFEQIVVYQLVPHWCGTPYNFYGATENPGNGTVACGYFVTTVLRDAGFPLNRIALAQAASEELVRSLVNESHIQRFRTVPLPDFLRAVKLMGEGLYVVGLDTHTGLLWYDGESQMQFIHSTSRRPTGVRSEPAADSQTLLKSDYRIIGNLTADEDFIKKWLRGQ